ncbi:MAG: Bug family tripartite tricarboxylate transporter substrate binding protein [Geminicoccaceae bacterium]
MSNLKSASVTKRVLIKLSCSGVLALAPFGAWAQEWQPSRPIDFVIMAGPGGGADQIARFIQSVTEKHDMTSRPLVPNNKGGGSGAEALLHLKSASDPDHTILVTLNSFFTTPLRQENLDIDIQNFTPIAMMGVDPFVLWVHKDSGITDFDAYVEQVQSMNGDFVMGGTGSGQEDSIVIAYMSGAYDLDINYIPYDGGGAVARDLAGQQIMATVNNPAEAKGFYEAGDFVPLLAFSDERLPAYPDVPTIKELGHDFSYYNQRAIVGAPGMSEEAAAYYRDLFTQVYESDEWQGYLESESLAPLWMDADEQRAYWSTQVDNHRDLLTKLDG